MLTFNAERAKQVKIIVPNSTAGLIIGKKGATIKHIMDTTLAKVQMTQKPEGNGMAPILERVITICGEPEQLFAAVDKIIEKIKADPQSASCPNLSYHNVQGLIANANPVGSPYAPVSAPQIESSIRGLNLANASILAYQNNRNQLIQANNLNQLIQPTPTSQSLIYSPVQLHFSNTPFTYSPGLPTTTCSQPVTTLSPVLNDSINQIQNQVSHHLTFNNAALQNLNLSNPANISPEITQNLTEVTQKSTNEIPPNEQ